MLQTRKNKSESVINMSGTEPTNEQIAHDIATKVMGWTIKEHNFPNGEKMTRFTNSRGHPLSRTRFNPTESHDDFMLAVEALTTEQRNEMAAIVVSKHPTLKPVIGWLTATLRTKCLALLAAVEEI